jgi:hypothetical protein
MGLNIDILFSNFNQILNLNLMIYKDFENLSNQSIGDLFIKYINDLDIYKTYCRNLATATEYLQKTRRERSQFQSFLNVSY